MSPKTVTPGACANCGERPKWVKVGKRTELHHKGETCPNRWEIWRKSRVESLRFWNLTARHRPSNPIQ